MVTLQIVLDDDVAEVARRMAAAEGKTLEVWAAEMIAQEVNARNKEWIGKFLEAAKATGGNPRGWKWNRDELYDR